MGARATDVYFQAVRVIDHAAARSTTSDFALSRRGDETGRPNKTKFLFPDLGSAGGHPHVSGHPHSFCSAARSACVAAGRFSCVARACACIARVSKRSASS